MSQGWKRLPLIVVCLLFWRTADGFKGGAYSNAHQWGQPSDTFSPRAVQSMSVAHVTGTLPVEEVGSTLFPNKPLRGRSKLNLLQFVKGGSSSYQSMSHAQTAPSSHASAFLPLPPVQQPSSSLMSSGSTIPGVSSGSNLETPYAGSGSGHLVSMQGESSSYPAKLGISGQSTSDSLLVSNSQETSVHQSEEASLPVFSQSISYSSSSAPGATSTSQSSPVLSESSGQPVSSQGEGSYSGLSQGASSQYTSDSSTKLSSTISHQSSGDHSALNPFISSSQDSSGTFLASGSSSLEVTGLSPLETSSRLLPLVSSQSTSGQSSPSLHVVSPQSSSDSKSTDAAASPYTQGSVSYSSLSSQAQGSATSQGSSGAELSASVPTQVGSDGYTGVPQSPTASSLYTPGSLLSNKLDSLPLGVSSQSTNAQSSPIVSTSDAQSRPGTQLATSSHYVPEQGGSSSTSLSLTSPGTLGQYAPASLTKYISGPTSSRTSYRAVSQVGSRSQTETSGLFPSLGGNYYSGLIPSQATSGQYALGYSKPISSPQSTSSQSASVLNSHKQYISASQGSSGAQFGALQGMSSSSSGSVPSQGSSSLYCKCALSPLDLDSQTTTVHSSPKRFTSSYGTQSGSSTPLTLQGSITYDGSSQPKVTASRFAPVSPSYPSVSSQSQGVVSQSNSRKQFTSTFTGSSGTQAGSSTPFTLHHTAYGGSSQPQRTASQFSPGSPSLYPGLSLSSPLGVASQSSSWKQFPSASQGSSVAQFGASTGFVPESGSSRYSGSVQSQDTASQFVPGSKPSYASLSLSSPQAVAGPTTLQSSRKQFTSTFTGSSGTQAGSSTPFTLHRNAYGGSSQPQHTASQFASGSSSPYASVSLSSPQGVASPSSQAYQGYSVSQSQQSQRRQPLATHWTQGIQTSDASQGRSSQSSPMQFSSLSPAGGSSSRVSGPFVSAQGGSTSYGGSFQSQSLSTKYTPGSQLLPYDPSVAGQGTSSASGVLSSYSSMNNQNAPAPSRSSSSSHFYSVKG